MYKWNFLIIHIYRQALDVGSMVLLRNSQRDGRKGGKLQQRWLGPYRVQILNVASSHWITVSTIAWLLFWRDQYF